MSLVGDTDVADAVRQATEALAARQHLDQSRVEMMRAYAETTGCRTRHLLAYFGEPAGPACGHCGNCDHPASGEPTSAQPFPVGERVTHEAWGEGTVIRYERDTVVVLFDAQGSKTLSVPVVSEGGLLSMAR